jgi:hypothetical protein
MNKIICIEHAEALGLNASAFPQRQILTTSALVKGVLLAD